MPHSARVTGAAATETKLTNTLTADAKITLENKNSTDVMLLPAISDTTAAENLALTLPGLATWSVTVGELFPGYGADDIYAVAREGFEIVVYHE